MSSLRDRSWPPLTFFFLALDSGAYLGLPLFLDDDIYLFIKTVITSLIYILVGRRQPPFN